MVRYFISFIFLIFFVNANAQDVILKTDGNELNGKVVEITLTDVKYLQAENKRDSAVNGKDSTVLKNVPDSALIYSSDTFSIPVSEVFIIKYANGTKEVFERNLAFNVDDIYVDTLKTDYAILGAEHGKKYFDGTPAFAIGLISAVFAGPLPAVAIVFFPPEMDISKLPDRELAKNETYEKAYKKAAHKKKIEYTAYGYGCGTAGIVLAYVAYVAFVFSLGFM